MMYWREGVDIPEGLGSLVDRDPFEEAERERRRQEYLEAFVHDRNGVRAAAARVGAFPEVSPDSGTPCDALITIGIPVGYEPLFEVLRRAFDHAAKGKGEERHGHGADFLDQPILAIQRLQGSTHGPAFQVMKKILEADKLPTDRAVHELLGAINYIAAMVIERERVK